MGERDTFLCFEDRCTDLDGADSMNRLEPQQETVGIDALHRAQFPKRCGVLRTNPERTIILEETGSIEFERMPCELAALPNSALIPLARHSATSFAHLELVIIREPLSLSQ